ncbi:CynX/NimT family MFS transporter [Pseudarthrobacter sp. NamE5]|uniref:CynX/NimT family MFS transporter n=1 Tax=Pseudarthrobacter sp. NamE5 TaxID=2576839 RepID=UPI00110A52EF|nr:CynX/NimT family MFS transporter [Pseudarthrobacter sp. NamE5]TLM80920.1 CynX/NimT family MFS transporter [Pseudarthrobacter sp. NamE5]
MSDSTAGLHMALFLLVGVGASLGTGAVMMRLSDQRAVGLTGSLLALTAFLGLARVPDLMLLWVICAALACGSLIVIALSLFSLRTTNHAQAAGLPGMAQSGGYAIAGQDLWLSACSTTRQVVSNFRCSSQRGAW